MRSKIFLARIECPDLKNAKLKILLSIFLPPLLPIPTSSYPIIQRHPRAVMATWDLHPLARKQ
jgi:hypothetical protein